MSHRLWKAGLRAGRVVGTIAETLREEGYGRGARGDTKALRGVHERGGPRHLDIFAPEAPFTPQSGTWGLQEIVAIPDRPGDYVFFVTLGQQQGEHVFDEGITEDGVLSWQSQPRQDFHSPQIREFIEHDEATNTIYLFFRTRKRAPYVYLGRLKYLSHDADRERPVYFQWQILDWEPPEEVLEGMGLVLQPSVDGEHETIPPAQKDVLQKTASPAPSAKKSGKGTKAFKAVKAPDYSVKEANNRELGLKGELLVLEHECRSSGFDPPARTDQS